MATGRPRYRFQYEMTISDTPLTRALEKGDFTTAILIIKNSASDPESLDEGPYERFPLYIVVSGSYEASDAALPNLQIAQLLLEHGAQANRRGPVYNDMESYSRSATPLELLVDIIRKIQLQHRYKQDISAVIGLDGHIKVQYEEVRDHLLRLMRIFIAHGGRLSFRPGILGLTHMVNILWTSPDVDFLRCLYETGVDMNWVDVHGRTALHLLCQAEYPPEAADMRLRAVSYLLNHTNIQPCKYSCKDHSCLWYALKYCHFNVVSLLLAHNPALDQTVGAKVFLSAKPEMCQTDILVAERLHPLLVPFVPVRDIYLNADRVRYANAPAQETQVLGPIATLVDRGFFCDPKADASISKVLDWNPKFQMHGKMLHQLCSKSQLVPFLFGRSSAKLKTLCARQIFQSCLLPFLSASQSEERKMDCDDSPGTPTDVGHWCIPSDERGDADSFFLHHLRLDPGTSKSIFDVDFADLTVLLENLRLPVSFLNVLEFELYRKKLLVTLSHSDSDRLKCTCLTDEQSQFDDVSSESSSPDDDSDFEGDGEAVSLVSVNFLQ